MLTSDFWMMIVLRQVVTTRFLVALLLRIALTYWVSLAQWLFLPAECTLQRHSLCYLLTVQCRYIVLEQSRAHL